MTDTVKASYLWESPAFPDWEDRQGNHQHPRLFDWAFRQKSGHVGEIGHNVSSEILSAVIDSR